jgi:radical SAM protein with 4Fe4S-binding SPASM domain
VTAADLPLPAARDGYGHARAPKRHTDPDPSRVDRVGYGRFRNVYLYISEACQLRCQHCYMGERLDRAMKMPLPQITDWLTTWRRMGGTKVTILGGEPTLHPDFTEAVRGAGRLGYEQVVTTTNAQEPALRKFRRMAPDDFAYVQVSLDGGRAESHDAIRGAGSFDTALATTRELARRGFDTRIICTVNSANRDDALRLLELADEAGVSLVKYHVFSAIGAGHLNPRLAVAPPEWIEFCELLDRLAVLYDTRVWYQSAYARLDQMARYAAEGYQGCIGRTLDRISVFPDGRAYVCSYLFDTHLNFAQMTGGQVTLNREANEFDLFTSALAYGACGGCTSAACLGGCPAEQVVTGTSSCGEHPGIVPVCRLWKSSAKPETPPEANG